MAVWVDPLIPNHTIYHNDGVSVTDTIQVSKHTRCGRFTYGRQYGSQFVRPRQSDDGDRLRLFDINLWRDVP